MAGQPGRGAPVRRGKAPPTNLPVVRDPLVGREREVVDAADRLLRDDVGHLTPTGVGGSGKTRLALRVAAVQPGFELTADNAGTVAALISQGHTNRQLAEALGITERTAEIHARNIREKLRFS